MPGRNARRPMPCDRHRPAGHGGRATSNFIFNLCSESSEYSLSLGRNLNRNKMFNSFGNLIRLTTFGESHGKCIGGVLDGFPSGIMIDEAFIEREMRRRRPGQSEITTQRNEKDDVEILSGVFNGRTTGAPIAYVVWNRDARPGDYESIKAVYRPSHADYTYQLKYGIRDYRGGGRSSARETSARCVAGAFAKMALRQLGIEIHAYTSQVGPVKMSRDYSKVDFDLTDSTAIRCPDPEVAQQMIEYVKGIKEAGDTIGGTVSCVIKNCPIGLGEPVYNKLHAQLGNAMLSINAAKAFEYGDGFDGIELTGSEQNDIFYNNHGYITTRTNHSGGIQGGISNGQDIFFRVVFKPSATISKSQHTVNDRGEEVDLKVNGRHDPCVLPRAVPVVEAMAALVILDFYLLDKTRQL